MACDQLFVSLSTPPYPLGSIILGQRASPRLFYGISRKQSPGHPLTVYCRIFHSLLSADLAKTSPFLISGSQWRNKSSTEHSRFRHTDHTPAPQWRWQWAPSLHHSRTQLHTNVNQGLDSRSRIQLGCHQHIVSDKRLPPLAIFSPSDNKIDAFKYTSVNRSGVGSSSSGGLSGVPLTPSLSPYISKVGFYSIFMS